MGDVECFEEHPTKFSAPTQPREYLAVRPFVPAYVDDDAVETAPLAFVDGDGECKHEGQLGPYTPSRTDFLGPATTPAARGRIVVCSLDASDGDDVTKINDLRSRPHSLKRLFEVMRSSLVFHADEDNVRQLGRRPGGAMLVHCPTAGPGPNAVVEHAGADCEE